jgi:DNA-binding response OmpR family regulator
VVSCNDGQIKLTPKECRLLGALMSNGGKVLSREDLMREVWDTDYMGDTRTLDVHIRYLRRKIEKDPSDPSRIITIRGVGYRLEVHRSG